MNMFLVNRNTVFPGEFIYDPRAIFMNGKEKQDNEVSEKSGLLNLNKQIQSISVILADDDADDRDLFKEAIESKSLNANLEFAEDGKHLIEILSNSNPLPHIIFLDLNMPHKSGFECLLEIRQTDRLKHIPVVIYSTSSSIKDIEETFEKGANLYVKKPSSFQDLENITSRVLQLDWNKYKPHASRQQFVFSSKTL